MKINKSFLQFVAAIWILIFHLWINLSGTQIEQYLIKTGYVGVDIFFFVSAYSLADKKLDYKGFLTNRFCTVYMKFFIFAFAALILKGWTTLKFAETVFFVSFFENGGGSFLWFIPAIMIFYILYPLFLKVPCKYKVLLFFAGWIVLTILLNNILGYTKIFIFTNRIPVILCGYLLKRHSVSKWIPMCCLPIGVALVYIYGFQGKLNYPFTDFYYILAIPLVIGLAGLSAGVKSDAFIKKISAASLEIYAMQMVIGTNWVNYFYSKTHTPFATNLLMLICVIGSSVILSKIYSKIPFTLKK